jgi:hypothetical protein
MTNVSAVPPTPPDGTIVAYAKAGKFSVKDSAGTVTALEPSHYNAVLDDYFEELPQQSAVRFIGATLEDDPLVGCTNVSIRTDYATTDGHVIYDSIGTAYAQRSKLIFRGDGLSAIVDEPDNSATAVVLAGGGGGSGGDITGYIANCVTKSPPGTFAFSEKTLTVAAGVAALVPNGKNSDGTWKGIQAQTSASQSIGESLAAATAGILFLMDDGTLQTIPAEHYFTGATPPGDRSDAVWYNADTNLATAYDAAGDELGQFFGVPIADFRTDAAGNVEEVKPRAVVNVANGVLFRYWED